MPVARLIRNRRVAPSRCLFNRLLCYYFSLEFSPLINIKNQTEPKNIAMDIKEAIFQRRSIRRYNDTPVSEEEVFDIIEAGMMAPSACNVQGWKFIYIDDTSLFEKIRTGGAAHFIKDASQAILVLYNNQTDNLEYSDYVQSASACIQNMLLMAHSLGIGTCWICHLPAKSYLRKVLGVPHNYDPIALITLGHYDQEVNPRPRKYEAKALVSFNGFSSDEPVPGRIQPKLALKRFARKVYFKMPAKHLVKPLLDKLEKKFNN